MSDLAWPIAVMLCLSFGEAGYLQLRGRQRVDWHDVVFNVNSGHIMLWLFRGLEITCYGYVASHWSLGLLANWPSAAVWLLALLAWDLGFYWLHRLHHQWPLFWAVHLIHHQGRQFNLSLGVRNSWYSSLTSIPFFMLLALVGVPLHVFVAVSVLHYTVQLYNHNDSVPRLRWLERLLITPALHRIHHVNEPRYCNSNYGGTFSFWDRLFGTFEPELPGGAFSYGVGSEKPSENPFWASNLPFFRLFGLKVGATPRPPSFAYGGLAMCSGAILLFILVLAYVDRYGYGYGNASSAQVALFVLLAAGAVALGGVSEGRRWAVVAWLAVTCALPAGYFSGLTWFGGFWPWFMAPLAIHGIAVAFGIGRRPLPLSAPSP